MPLCGSRRTQLPLRPSPALVLELQTDLSCTRNDIFCIYNRFRKLAPSGFLTLSKFQECLGLLGNIGKLLSECMFVAFDRNGDGYLDFVEYGTSVLTMLNGSEKHRMELSYRILCTTTRSVCCAPNREQALEDEGNSPSHSGCIDLDGFQNLVKDITATRNVLIGNNCNHYNEDYIAQIFDKHASLCDDGVKRISQHDFMRAVQCSDDFVELLGAPSINCAVEASIASKKTLRVPGVVRNRQIAKYGSDDGSGKRCKTYINRTNVRCPKAGARNTAHGANIEAPANNARPRRRSGLAVYFGHERWNDVINMMIALGLAARRVSKESDGEATPEEFKEKRVFSISPNMDIGVEPSLNFVEEGQESFKSADGQRRIIFTEHAPQVFKRLRKLTNLSETEYIESVGPEHLVGNMVLGNLSTLSELVSEGKSGALFYFTANGRLVLKTLTAKCAAFVQEWLPSYYEHVRQNPDTLITRILGLFSITTTKNHVIPTYFMVMNNVFYSSVAIHRRYDLKGSWVGRTVPQNERKDHTVALKDCDMQELGEYIELEEGKSKEFLAVLTKDVEFLSRSSLLDYSLLLGIHYRSMSEDDVDWKSNLEQCHQRCLMGKGRDRLYFLSIIDVLTSWDFTKKAESLWRRIITFNNSGVSCINPQQYGQRFLNSINKRIR